MPLFFVPPISFPTSIGATLVATQEEGRQTYRISDEFSVSAQSVSQDFAGNGSLIFAGGVTAQYGQTAIRCDKLTLDLKAKKGVAEDNVVITDPEGTVSCQDLHLDWNDGVKSGVARNAVVQTGGVEITAASLEINPDKWTLRDLEFTLHDLKRGRTRIIAERAILQPGRDGTAYHVWFQVLGQRLGPVPKFSFNLDRRIGGITFPKPSIRTNKGIGVNWDNGVLVRDDTAFSFGVATFPKTIPTYYATLTYSPIKPKDGLGPLQPTNDLDERYTNGWFDNIGVKSPEEERALLRRPKLSYSLGTTINFGTVGRAEDADRVSKAVDLSLESGGGFGDFGVLGSTRYERIQSGPGTKWVDRGVVSGTVSLPPVSLGDKLAWVNRGDAFGFVSQDNAFGVGRLETGLQSGDLGGFRLGAGLAYGGETGTPDFGFDRLGYRSAFLLRADYQRGPYTLRYLAKYDALSKEWFDHEWEIAFAAGSFEPFITRREFPGEIRIGVRLRLDTFFNRIEQRKIERPVTSK